MKHLLKSAILSLALVASVQSYSEATMIPRSDIEAYAPTELPWELFQNLKKMDNVTHKDIEYGHKDKDQKDIFVASMPSSTRAALSYALSFATTKTTLGKNPTFKFADYQLGDQFVTLTYRYVIKNSLRSLASYANLLEATPGYDLTFIAHLKDEDVTNISQIATEIESKTSPRFLIEKARDHVLDKIIQGLSEEIFTVDYFLTIANIVKEQYASFLTKASQIEKMKEGSKKEAKINEIVEYTTRVMKSINEAYDRESDNAKETGKLVQLSDDDYVSGDSDSESESDSESDEESEESSNVIIKSEPAPKALPSAMPSRNDLLDAIRAGKELKKIDTKAALQKGPKGDGSILDALRATMENRRKAIAGLNNNNNNDDDGSNFED